MPKTERCPDCGREVLKVAYQRDLSKHAPRGYLTYVSLDPTPAADQADEKANYAVSIGRTWCHQITEEWPLIPPERRHFHHNYACPARRGAAFVPGGQHA